MQLTLNEFKEKISGMTADEMIDMMPKSIDLGEYGIRDIYTLKYDNISIGYGCRYGGLLWEEPSFRSYVIQFRHRENSERDMLLRLFENNHLSEYKLKE